MHPNVLQLYMISKLITALCVRKSPYYKNGSLNSANGKSYVRVDSKSLLRSLDFSCRGMCLYIEAARLLTREVWYWWKYVHAIIPCRIFYIPVCYPKV